MKYSKALHWIIWEINPTKIATASIYEKIYVYSFELSNFRECYAKLQYCYKRLSFQISTLSRRSIYLIKITRQKLMHGVD